MISLTFLISSSNIVSSSAALSQFFQNLANAWQVTTSIGIKTEEGWLGTKIKIDNTTDDGQVIYELGRNFMTKHWADQEARQVQIVALSPTECRQQDLFLDNTHQIKREKINQAIDKINERYGEFTVAPMPVIGRSEMPNVIAPAWKPTGHRKTI